MTSLLQQFVAQRAARQKKPVTNDAQPVTRAEFNTLVQAVHGLIEDFEAATAPEKMQEVFANALKPLVDGVKPATNANALSGKYRLPSDDDEGGSAIVNLSEKLGYCSPEGD